MKRVLLLPLFLAGCFGGPGWSGDPGMMMSMGQRDKEVPWPTVRIDEPVGAHVLMEAGVFGNGISAALPLEGQFQPTAAATRAGYPLEIKLEGTGAHRYGVNKPTTIYARLNINQTMKRHGILVIAPSECMLRALVAGDLEEVKVAADVLPMADQVCRELASAPKMHGDEHDMQHGSEAASCPMHGGGCPMMHGGGGCMHHDKGGCGGGTHEQGGCGGGMGHGMFHVPPPGAVLTMRMTKF